MNIGFACGQCYTRLPLNGKVGAKAVWLHDVASLFSGLAEYQTKIEADTRHADTSHRIDVLEAKG